MEVAEVREQNRVLKSSCQSNLDSKSDQCLQVSGGDKESLSPADASVKLRKGMATSSNQVEHAGVLPVPASPIIGPTAPVLAGNPIPVLHHFQGQAQGIMPTIPTAPSQINQSNFSNPVVIPAQQHLPMLHHQVLQSKLIQQPQLSQRFTHPQALPGYSHFPETKSPVSVQARAVHPQHQPIEQQSRDQVIIEQGRLNGLDMPHLPSVSASQHSVNMQNSSEPPLGKHQDSNPFIEKQASQMGEEVHVNDVQIKDGFVKILVPEAKEEQFEHQDIPDRALEDKPSDKEVEHMEMYTQHPVLHAVDHSKPSPLRDTADPLLVVGSRVEEQPLISSHAPPVHSAPDQDSNGKQGTGVQSTPLSATTASMNQISTTEGNSKVSTHMLLDEKSLLACLVRAIPSEASARIRISTTLPNRLGKILAPLHWHDYKKVYGRLDDFISSHPKLFVIDGDFVHLREGAHAIISATTAVAKVAAAAAAPPSFGTTWPPTVAITPVAQSQFQRTRRTHPSTFFGAKDTSGSSGNNIKQDDLFSHIQMIGDHQSHQGSQHQQGSYPLNGIRNASGPFGSRQERVLCTGSSGEISGIPSPYGASSAQRKNDIIFGGRSNTVDAESFARKDYPGLSQTQENRVAHSS
ncbi:hypothetical protein KP509_1Z193200 [Ceratopteris richardii]|nr:hypothetical protein KP509_1Z193200 [Ceratopteris richardii]